MFWPGRRAKYSSKICGEFAAETSYQGLNLGKSCGVQLRQRREARRMLPVTQKRYFGDAVHAIERLHRYQVLPTGASKIEVHALPWRPRLCGSGKKHPAVATLMLRVEVQLPCVWPDTQAGWRRDQRRAEIVGKRVNAVHNFGIQRTRCLST